MSRPVITKEMMTMAWVERRFAASIGVMDERDGRQDEGALRGDYDLNPDMRAEPPLTPAAVLVPIVDRPEGPCVLLTQRTDHLHHHAGQVSFPGGRVEPEDGGAVEAALRETEEEIGLHRRHIKVIGRLDTYETRTGFTIEPVVAKVTPPFELQPDPFEVADAFEVPLTFLMDPSNHEKHSRHYEGVERFFYAMPYEGRFIWGATAGMLVNLYQFLVRP